VIVCFSNLDAREKEGEKEFFQLIEQRRIWLEKNGQLLAEVTTDQRGSSQFDRLELSDGSYFLFSGTTEYNGIMIVNKNRCSSVRGEPCSVVDLLKTDYLVPVYIFTGSFFSARGRDTEMQSEESADAGPIVVNPWPVIEHKQSYSMRIDPLSWFLILGCSSVSMQINCEAARREGEQRRGNYFYIQSDGIGRIVQVDEYWGNHLIERQRFFYDSSASLMDQFALEYREARGHYSLLYVFDPLGNRGRHALFGY
jgi:hypothetical protein